MVHLKISFCQSKSFYIINNHTIKKKRASLSKKPIVMNHPNNGFNTPPRTAAQPNLALNNGAPPVAPRQRIVSQAEKDYLRMKL